MSAAQEVIIVGGGPAGLSAAIELRRLGVACAVLEREPEPGGIPRHSDHLGFGVGDLHRLLTGPQYARRLADLADRAGATIRTTSSVTGWGEGRTLRTTSPRGIEELGGAAVLLATGCRERPRAARLVPGSRAPGVLTTGALQELVALGGRPRGSRAVIVGAEHVSYSAALTLRQAGVRVVAMITEHARTQTYTPVDLAARVYPGAPLRTGLRLTEIMGRDRITGVRVADAVGRSSTFDCDLVVFTADWTPNGELARAGGLAMDPGTRGPRVDAAFRTSGEGIFAIGNVLRGAETANVVAAEGTRAAASVARWLEGERWPSGGVGIEVDDPLAWVCPNVLEGPGPEPGPTKLTLRVRSAVEGAPVAVTQGGRELWSGHLRSGALASFAPWLPGTRFRRLVLPGRPAYLPADWARKVTPDGGPVRIRVAAS